jgi:hypothetical protein
VVAFALGVSALTTVCMRLFRFFWVSSPNHPKRNLRPHRLRRRGYVQLGRHLNHPKRNLLPHRLLRRGLLPLGNYRVC